MTPLRVLLLRVNLEEKFFSKKSEIPETINLFSVGFNWVFQKIVLTR